MANESNETARSPQSEQEHTPAPGICLLQDQTAQALAETFKVLGDPTRIKILDLLAKQEMCVYDIAATLQMGQSAISHQLRVLRGARLVKFRKDGKEVRYSLDDDHVVLLMNQGLEHIRHN